ncbi:MAG: type II secretion system F family protein [Candidatus Hydrogenedentota bacterium]|nr:MAG: type II secretion system F family protein [Candidatus Hydrogenedentota bacterium]
MVEGVLEAGAERDVLLNLRRRNLKVLLIEEKKETWYDLLGKWMHRKVKLREIVRFTSMFSTLVNAAVPMSSCLRTLQEQTDNIALKEILENVQQEIEGGMDLSTALGMHPQAFNRMYVDLVRAGETSGTLGIILERLAAYTEKTEKLRRRIKSALTYPAVVVAISFLIVWVILQFVVPKFAETFAQFGKDLPLPTVILLEVSNVVRNFYALVLLAGVGAYFGIRTLLKNDSFRKTWDTMVLKIPFFGELILKSSLARFTRTLAMLLDSGIPIIQALQIVSHVAGNRLITDTVFAAADAITSGESFSDTLRKGEVFPPIVIQMVSVGEATGNLPAMLNKIADFYEDEVDIVIESLSSLIEPLMIVFLGVVLGYVIIALFLPILSLSEAVKF